jgi:flagellar biosynthesis protein FlhF
MQIKRFEAKTMTAALKMVKDEFGPDAVILSARTLRRSGFFGAARPTGVEVTAARDYAWPIAPDPVRLPAVETAARPDAAERRGILKSLNEGLRSLGRRRAGAEAAEDPGTSPELADLHQHLLGQEVAREVAADLVEQIRRMPGYDPRLKLNQLRPHAAAALQDAGVRHAVGTPDQGTARMVALVGPAGAGKTTLAIKLAVVEALGKGRRVALMTLDDQRIGAVEQLKIYAGILGLPMQVAPTAEDAVNRIKALGPADVVIIDTPGVGPAEPDRREGVRRALAALGCREIHLVLNACIREQDALAAIDGWKSLPVQHLAFTRLDETGTCGGLLNLLVRTRLPLSYLGTGPRIPEDLADRPAELLLSRIWPADPGAAFAGPGHRSPAVASTPPGAGLVANRNSDLYHRPDCKWVRKIKSENLVHFLSPAEAEARHFIPCRNCSPDLAAIDPAAAPWDGRRISAYR